MLARSRSIDTDLDEDLAPSGDAATTSQSPTQSPRSDDSAAQGPWTAPHEQAAQDAYDMELAEQYIYDLMRLLASATRALAMYDMTLCKEELDKLPHVHQRSPFIMAMLGRAHYERTDYVAVRTSACCPPHSTPSRYRYRYDTGF